MEGRDHPTAKLSRSAGSASLARARKTPATITRSINQSTWPPPPDSYPDGNIGKTTDTRISELVALQERTYMLPQRAERRAVEEEARAARREDQANRRADILERMLLSIPGENPLHHHVVSPISTASLVLHKPC
ncbi:hypothetical protein H4Q26_003168 [Puccinia striiformis f. sp. tritici PST-130]|nr:hypothetical protein H4Q26_003168 [Puccinia striiformis f. sp. tritici PST-130]